MPGGFRRKILYIPGFDPFPPRRYRELFRRESALQAAISGYEVELSPRANGGNFGWHCKGRFSQGNAGAGFEVLLWADLVRDSMRHGIIGTYRQLFRTARTYICSGALFRLMRLRRGPVLAALYPIVMLLLQAFLALVAGYLVGALFCNWFGWWAGLPVWLICIWAVLQVFRRLDGRIFAYYLMHDYAFTAQHNGAYPQILETRLAEFADHLAETMTEELDEVLIVGHSSGAYLAISLLADYIRAGRMPTNGPALALLSLGHVVPMASFLPDATRLRQDLAYLSERQEIFWLDVTAPGDPCCFGLCDPVAVTGVAGPGKLWPLVISAAFKHTLTRETRKALRWRWFRLHFQYICAFDRPGDYDYFAITAGPIPLAERFANRAHSPSRILTPAGPGL